MTNDLHFKFYGPQYDFVVAPQHYVALCGGIGSGKSYAGAIRTLTAALGQIGEKRVPTPNLGIVTAATYPMLRDATFRVFREIARPFIADVNMSEFRVTLTNESEILFRSATNPDGLRGPTILYWWGDEAALYGDMVWKIMIGRLRQFGMHGYAWPTTTPKGRNWLYQRFVETADEDYRIIRASTRANPFLSEEYVASLEADYTGDFARQELEGDFVLFEGLIYLEFQRDTHVVTEWPQSFKRVVAGVDWGYANPGVILVVGLDYDDRAWIIHEEYRRQTRIEEWATLAKQLASTYSIETFFCDPSEPDFIEAFAEQGCYAEGANNDVLPGIQEVKARLARRGDGLPRLLLTPDAANTIVEFGQYQWMETRDGVRDRPKKINDHAMDALRYACMGVAADDSYGWGRAPWTDDRW